jgi:1-acyl-sn-glycerol-3-phosphate acyltransferase
LIRVLSALRVLVSFLVIATTAIVWMALAVPLLPMRVWRIKLCNLYGKLVGRTVVFLSGARVEVHDRDRIDASFPAIYVANHASSLDAFLSIWLCPIGGCGVMKKEVVRVPFFGQLYWLSGHLLLDRENRARARSAMDGVAALVKRYGLGVWIMPEGHRAADGRLARFKPGFVHLAIATGLPVVPVIIEGAQKVWAPRTLTLRPGKVTVRVLPPVATNEWHAETAQVHADAVHALLAEALPEEQQPSR